MLGVRNSADSGIFLLKAGFDLGKQTDSEERIAPQAEKIVVDPDVAGLQDFFPQPGQV